MNRSCRFIVFLSVLFALFVCLPGVCYAVDEPPEVNWVSGPTTANLEDIAKLNVKGDYLYLNKADTVSMMEYFGNPSNDTEIGSLFPVSEDETWFIVFDYFDVGHVSDEDRNDIDADAILESVRQGTEEANQERKKNGDPQLYIKGWFEKPEYNQDLHSLAWCILYESEDGGSIVNYEAKLLSREGYVAATLVCSDTELETLKPVFNQVMKDFSFTEGNRYEDYIPGQDRLSDMGLAALIIGGAAVAKKGFLVGLLVLLKKFGVIIVVAVGAFFTKIFKRKKSPLQENTVQADSETVPEEEPYDDVWHKDADA